MSIENKDGIDQMKNFISWLKMKSIIHPLNLALNTLEVFNKLIESIRWSYPSEIYGILRAWACKLSENCRPHGVVSENIALRILKILQDAHNEIFNKVSEEDEDSLHFLVKGKFMGRDDTGSSTTTEMNMDEETAANFLSHVSEELQNLRNELETSSDDVSRQALQHIHSNETIMVYGYSVTTEAFLRTAAKRRKFRLIVAEASPQQMGHIMVKRLVASGIEITLIPDSAIFAIMSRVNKVIIGVNSISADGSLCCASGTHALALSANQNGVPVLVCSGLFKLSPRYPHVSSVSGRDTDDTMPTSPEPILDFYTAGALGDVEVLNPSYDHVPANLVTLFITNLGAQSPSYMYRVLKELYRPEDLVSFE